MNAQNQNGYLLLFRGNEWYHELSLEEIRKINSQCKAWFERLAENGKVKGGQVLVRKGAIVSGKSGQVVLDGPFAESKEAIGGYLMVDVASLEEAIAIARTNPSLPYGTSIEVRPVAEECPLEACARQIPSEEQFETANA